MFARLLAVTCLVGLTLSMAGRAESTSMNEVKAVAKALELTFQSLDSKVTTEFEERGDSVSASYLPQTYKIHHVAKSGAISKEAHDEVGPSHKGFVLHVNVQPKGQVNSAVTPQILRRPYWLTDLFVTPLAHSDKQLFWSLSYGAQTDQKLLDEIRTKLKKLGE